MKKLNPEKGKDDKVFYSLLIEDIKFVANCEGIKLTDDIIEYVKNKYDPDYYNEIKKIIDGKTTTS